MKIRSKQLYNYLIQSGALHGTEEAIALARRQYRREYKKNWKKQARPRKEIRFAVTLKEFAVIREKARMADMRHTTYIRKLVASDCSPFVLNTDRLYEVLQAISMATIALEKLATPSAVLTVLQTAEDTLMLYLKQSHENK